MSAGFPTNATAEKAVEQSLGWRPAEVVRFTTGSGHFVFDVTAPDGGKVVARIGMPDRERPLRDGMVLARKLLGLGVPLPRHLGDGVVDGFPYTIIERFAGTDLGDVIAGLKEPQLHAIAVYVAKAQAATARLGAAQRYGYAATGDAAPHPSWSLVLDAHLGRSRRLLASAGLFDLAVCDPVAARLEAARTTLDRQAAVPFLHDTTTRNVLVDETGGFSGIVDVDDLCFGDPRWAAALTRAVLLMNGWPRSYVRYWLAAAGEADDEIFALYVALFLLDLMSEHGQVYNGNERPSTPEARAALLAALAEVLG